MAMVGGNSMIAVSSPVYPEYKVYGSLVSDIVECESSGRHEGVWGDEGMAYGIAQFWESTFYEFAEKAGLQEPDWKNEQQQLWLLNWALQNGKSGHWTCFKKVGIVNN